MNDDKHIFDKNKKGNNPFSVPKGYFSSLKDELKSFTADNETLDLPSQTPFSVPEGYLHNLKSDLKKQDSSKRVTWYLSIAACLALLLFFGVTESVDPKINGSSSVATSEFQLAESEDGYGELAYVEEYYLDDIDITDIVELESTETKVETETEVLPNVEDEEIEEYLEEELDLDDLMIYEY